MDFVDDPADSSLTAVFEIPGIKTSDISLHIVDGHLVVSGERRPTYNTTQQSEARPQNTAEGGVQEPRLFIPIQELRFGTFRRAVRIPEGLKVSVPFASSFSIVRPHLSPLLSF
jgi:HSP20 family molecular chaperone IbpA